MQEQELFQSYELKNWDFNPRIYKILAVSAIFNILALLVVGQTSLLTTKGCDSPLVGGVCQVIDTLYVGGTILTTKTETAEVPYEPTTISPDDEIVWIPVAEDPFKYPAGYFATSNPELMMPQEIPNADGTFPTNIPGIPNPTTNPTIGGGTNDLLNQPQQLPDSNPNAVIGQLPSSPLGGGGGGNPTISRPGRYRPGKIRTPKNNPTLTDKSPNELPNLTNDQTAKKEPENKIDPKAVTPTPDPDDVAKEDQYGVFKNKKPLKDFAKRATAEVKNVKLDAPFSVTIAADLDYGKDGKTIVLKNPKLIKTNAQTPNDEQMAKLAQDAILAVGDSGWLGYLRTVVGLKKVVFTLSQDNDNITANILGEQKDENSAKTSASGLTGIISLGKAASDGDEKVLLEGASVTSEGKSVILKFAIPKQMAIEMINRKLKEAEQNQNEPKQNGSTAQIKESNQKSAK
jgi:hypothetical protein